MTNSTNLTIPNQVGYMGYIIAPFSIVTTSVNVFFFFLCIKTLKKKVHNMLVISMCGGDCLHGLSLFILSFVNKIGKYSSDLCLSQITIYFISLNISLTIALIISVERYITVKLKNYGFLTHSERWKKKMAGILIASTSGYVILCILLMPNEKNETNTCYLVLHYDPYHYRILMSLLSFLFVFLVVAISVLYVLIVFMLFILVKKWKRVASVVDVPLRTISTVNQPDVIQNNKVTIHGQRNDPRFNDLFDISIGKPIEEESEVDCGDQADDISLRFSSPVQFQKNPTSPSDVGINICNYRHGRDFGPVTQECSTDGSVSMETRGQGPWNQWEMKALATSSYIIGSTLLLHGPLVLCLVASALGIPVSARVGDIVALLVALRCVIDPFIYAFRFKELRDAMKNIICCKWKKRSDMSTNDAKESQVTEHNKI